MTRLRTIYIFVSVRSTSLISTAIKQEHSYHPLMKSSSRVLTKKERNW